MGTAASANASHGRRLVVAALVALAGVTGVTFGRVFQGWPSATRLAVAGVAAVLIAALLQRRHLALSLLASAAGLVVTLGALVFPETTLAWIPTAETVDAALAALARAGERAAHEVAPAPPLPSLMTASLIAVWCACTASHALAVRAGSTVLPLLPGASLLGFVGVVTEEPPRPGYVVAFLAASFLLLFAEALSRTGGWWVGRNLRPVVSTRSARVLGVVAVVAALAVPGLLPGYGDAAILRLGEGAERISVSPIVDIRPNLLQNPPAELFRVRAGRPAYWRMVVLDHFDGNVWSSTGLDEVRGPLLQGPARLAGPGPVSGAPLEQRFVIEDLETTWLPSASEPQHLDVDPGLGARFDLDTGVVVVDAATESGVTYDVTSWTPNPPAEALLLIDPSEDHREYQSLPHTLPYRIRQITARITRRAETPFEKVLSIQEHLRTFTYDEHAPVGHGSNAMLNFLEETRQGYCEQFAGTMAVMVRALGLPARVAVGFLPGERDRSGMYRVTTGQVHAWPEVYFREYGWLAFEPTPSRSNPTADYLIPGSSGRPFLAGRVGGPNARETAAGPRENFQRLRPDALPGTDAPRRDVRRPDAGTPWGTIGLLAALGGALIAVGIAAAKAVRRRLSVRPGTEPRRRVVNAYAWMAGVAGDVGVPRVAGETMLEYRARLATERQIDPRPLDRLTALATRAAYADSRVDGRDGEEAVGLARAVGRSLRRRAGAVRVLVGAIRPA